MIVIESEHEFKKMVAESVRELVQEHITERFNQKLYSKKTAATMLGISYSKILDLVKSNSLKTTADGVFITYKSIQEYTRN